MACASRTRKSRVRRNLRSTTSARSSAGAGAASSATAGGEWGFSGTPQMEMGSGWVASSTLRSASALSSDDGSAAATYESSLKEGERSSAVASMSEDMRLRLEAGAATGLRAAASSSLPPPQRFVAEQM
ncbi:unnamed protein product [Miscanthus lutarioriparius]|uniref:Uncharacterized protein n=1 Tax=Miscanthus lutarioriparius TaxID=422564 RepID=A0A811RH18_9POAL|nr:unnamed protein product [Miscanthus lutarioriparius]